MSTQHNVRVELDLRPREDDTDTLENLFDALTAYHAVVTRGPRGHIAALLTVPATDVIQAVQTAAAVVTTALPARVLAIEAMTTEEFDRREGFEPLPELLSVPEAAAMLGITRQAVGQRIESGSLPATRIGKSYVLHREIVERLARPVAGTE